MDDKYQTVISDCSTSFVFCRYRAPISTTSAVEPQYWTQYRGISTHSHFTKRNLAINHNHESRHISYCHLTNIRFTQLQKWSFFPPKITVKVVKIKCTLVQALRICTERTAHRGSRDIALLFYGHGIRRGWRVSVRPQPLFTPGKDLVPILQEAGWAPGQVWTVAENLAHTGIRFPYRPTRSH